MAYIKEVRNKKGVTYQVNIRHKNYKPVYKTFWDLEPNKAKKAAKLWAKEVELQMDKGTYKEEKTFESDDLRSGIKTVEDLIRYFQQEIAPERYQHNAPKYDCMYDFWIGKIGKIKVKDLSSSMISSCKQALKSEPIIKGKDKTTGEPKYTKRGNNTVNKYIMCLSAVLKYAVKELEIIEVNPCSNVELLKKPKGRTRFLTEEEIPIVAKCCYEHSDTLFLFFILLIATGGRYSEVRFLNVENIDFKNNRVSFVNTKNKTHRGVGIKPEYTGYIKKYLDKHNITTGPIFINKNKKPLYLRGVLQQAFDKAGLEDFHIHDLRHTFASDAAKEGASLLDIAILLGHKSLVMARRYTHLTQQYTDTIARKVADSLPIPDELFQ